MVKKQDESHRFCLDFRKVNKLTKVDSFPMLLVTKALYSSGGTIIFSTFYLKSGFWQIEMNPNSREKTASATHKDVN